jgi:hypothetical protein
MKFIFFLLSYASLFLILSEKEISVNRTQPSVSMDRSFLPRSHAIIMIPNPGNGHNLQPYLQAAIDTARDGDELHLPEGAFTIYKTVRIHKFISIHGAGMGKTLLSRPENMPDSILASDSMKCLFRFAIQREEFSHILISDICFQGKHPCVHTGDGGSLAPDIGLEFIRCLGFTVTHCRFENFGNAAISVTHSDRKVNGLISKNQFYHNVKGPEGLGLGYGIAIFGENNEWTPLPGFGTSNFIFVEDNTFSFHRHAIAAGGCGRYVFRHNTVLNNCIGRHSGQAIDAHEARQKPGLNYYSTRAVEIYDNRIINTTFKDGSPIVSGRNAKDLVENAILIRGGEALIHDNTIEGYRFGIGLINFEATASDRYPLFTQPGYASAIKYGSTHTGADSIYGDGDLFVWNNNFSPYQSIDTSSMFYNYQPIYFKEGRDYHLQPKPLYRPYPYPFIFLETQND